MLKLEDEFKELSTSNAFISHHFEPINVMAVGTWDGNTLTIQVNPDPKRESWVNLQQGGSAITLTDTNNLRALTLPGGVHVRFTSTTGAATDLNLWVGGRGVSLVSPEAP